MPPKSTEKKSKHKKRPSNYKKRNSIKDTDILETTYEKVLSIINNVKELIKKYVKNSKDVIHDLEWVIKVISNKSLYTYEVKRPMRQDSEYDRFVNFFTKFNEDVIEMNKKHVLVSGLISLVKKGEILNKPSLYLKKILPEDLKNMDYKKEMEKEKRKKNIINLIGNAILNLYYRNIEKRKEDEKENKKKTNGRIEKIPMNKKSIYIKTENDIERNRICLTSNNNYNNDNTYNSKEKANSRNFVFSKKNDNKSLYSIKNTMDIYYSKYVLNETQTYRPFHQFMIKGNLMKEKTKKKGIKNNNSTEGKNRNNCIEKCSKNKFKKNKNLDKNKSIEIRSELNLYKKKIRNNPNGFNNYCPTDSNKKNKSFTNKNTKKDGYKNIQTTERKNNNNQNIFCRIYNEKMNDIMNNKKNKNNILGKEERMSIKKLEENYFEDLKMITDKDFDIFDFKLKVGYKNVLPLMCHCILKILGLLDNRIIVLSKIESFLYAVSDNYRESSLYHNCLHGADVTQSLCIYFINTKAEQICETSVLDLLGIFVSAIGHDLGHPGLTNNFHINAGTDLALTYNDSSCLENYHCSYLFKIIRKDENNIFEKFNMDNYKKIRKRIISQILATDMANHGEVISLIKTKIKTYKEKWEEGEEREEGENSEEKIKFILLSGNEKTKFDEQQILLNYLIHCADLGHNCKKYEICIKWIKLLCEEFWLQGDKEKSMNIPVSFLCDREKIDVPSSQIGFLKGFIFSTFDILVEIFPPLDFTMKNAKRNLNKWQKLLDQNRKTGWSPKKEKNEDNE